MNQRSQLFYFFMILVKILMVRKGLHVDEISFLVLLSFFPTLWRMKVLLSIGKETISKKQLSSNLIWTTELSYEAKAFSFTLVQHILRVQALKLAIILVNKWNRNLLKCPRGLNVCLHNTIVFCCYFTFT